MKKLLISAFACTAAMLIACGDDGSSADDTTDSSSSVADASSCSNVIESGSSIFFHQKGCGIPCISAKDTTTMFLYSYEGPDSAVTVTKYEYPIENKEAVENCLEAFAEKTDEQKLDCDSVITTINPSQNMTYMDLISLVEKECKPFLLEPFL